METATVHVKSMGRSPEHCLRGFFVRVAGRASGRSNAAMNYDLKFEQYAAATPLDEPEQLRSAVTANSFC